MTDPRISSSEQVLPITPKKAMPLTNPINSRLKALDWRRLARRRWLLLIAGVAVVALALWAMLGGNDIAPSTDEEHAEGAPADTILRLDSIAQRLAGVELLTVTLGGSGELVANGTITYDANHVSVLSSRAEGRVISVRADLGENVAAGATLALLESPLVGQTRGALERAQANLAAARRNYEREKRLFDQSISSQKELLEAEAAFRSATADQRSAVSELTALGARGGQGATFGLVTPIGGTVVERNASPGQAVGPSSNLFTVADLRHVWINVDIYEGDLRRVRQNAEAVVAPNALPGESFTGRVTYAGGVVDTTSHTFKVRVELQNPGQRLRPGMFAQVRIKTLRMAEDTSLVIPQLAVQEVAGQQIVFVAGQIPGQFIVRPVALGPEGSGGSVAVTKGLRAGERIATAGAFQLKAELTKASFGEGHH